jgi:hypothetical protein
MSTSTNVQLGHSSSGSSNSPLLHNTFINTTASYKLTIYGESASTEALLVSNYSGGRAFFAQTNSGVAIYSQANTGLFFSGVLTPTDQNSVLETVKFDRQTTGGGSVGQNGIGQSIGMYLQSSTTAGRLSNQIISSFTDATDATRTSQLDITGVNSSVTATLFSLKGTGQLQLTKYGIGTFTGTPAYTLQVDASGNIIEGSTGGGSITADNGLTANTATNVQLGGTLLQNTTVAGGASFVMAFSGSGSQRTLEAYSTGGGLGLRTYTQNATTNTVLEAIHIGRASSGTAANGIGVSAVFTPQTSDGSLTRANNITSKWTDATLGTRTSQLDINGVNNTSDATIASFYGSGVVGIGISSSYTATRLNVVDNALAGGSMVDLTSTSTAAASDIQKLLNISLSGANATSQTTYGAYISNAHSGAGSTNYGLYVTASSGVSANIGIRGNAETYGVFGESSGGIGVRGTTVSGTYAGVFIANGSGGGISGSTQTGLAGILEQTASAATNDVTDLLEIRRQTTGTAAAGFGARFGYWLENDAGAMVVAGGVTTFWKVATAASRTSNVIVEAVNATATVTSLTIGGEGFIQLRPITATAASAITPAEGMLVFVDSTNGTFAAIGIHCYENGAWAKL